MACIQIFSKVLKNRPAVTKLINNAPIKINNWLLHTVSQKMCTHPRLYLQIVFINHNCHLSHFIFCYVKKGFPDLELRFFFFWNKMELHGPLRLKSRLKKDPDPEVCFFCCFTSGNFCFFHKLFWAFEPYFPPRCNRYEMVNFNEYCLIYIFSFFSDDAATVLLRRLSSWLRG